MAFVVDTTDSRGRPHCPICRDPVPVEGAFCSPTCWEEFHLLIFEMASIVDMTYLPLTDQPWYGKVT